MEKLDNQIEQKERELQQLKSYRQTAKIEEIATIDQNIISAELQIKRLKESQLLQILHVCHSLYTQECTPLL